MLVDLPGERDPRVMELCADHAQRATVPLGWELRDERVVDVVEVAPSGPPTVTELRSPTTVETIAAALHDRDEQPSEAPTDDLADVPADDPDVLSEAVVTMAQPPDRADDPTSGSTGQDASSAPPAGPRMMGEQPELPLELRLPRQVPGAARA